MNKEYTKIILLSRYKTIVLLFIEYVLMFRAFEYNAFWIESKLSKGGQWQILWSATKIQDCRAEVEAQLVQLSQYF